MITVIISMCLSHQPLTTALLRASPWGWEGLNVSKAETQPGIYYSLLGARGTDTWPKYAKDPCSLTPASRLKNLRSVCLSPKEISLVASSP